MKKILGLVLGLVLIVTACGSDNENEEGPVAQGFDRKAMLVTMADDIIVPSYQKFTADVQALKTATTSFTTDATTVNLMSLRSAWQTAYISWQSVSMFEIGKAEEVSYRNFINVFPVNATNIESNIASGSYDFTSISLQDEQGLGALDYMINGLGTTDAAIVEFYTTNEAATKYKAYLTALVNRIEALTTEVLTSWTSGYRDTFVNNSGSSATSSVDKIVNDYIFHYEKHLRAGKVGIPAGVFSNDILEDKVEAFYKGDLSKTLLVANLEAMQNIFNKTFKTYIDALSTEAPGLSTLINTQFSTAFTAISTLDSNLSTAVSSTDNTAVLKAYDELQKNVVFFKIDMVQAMGITIDFVDADGD